MSFLDKAGIELRKARQLIKRVLFSDQDADELMDERAFLLKETAQALREWKIAQNNLNFVQGKEAIDFSIYSIQAAEQKYINLLNKAREANTVDDSLQKTVCG